MVKATAGALLTCDVPTKEYLKWLHNQFRDGKIRGAPFVILDVDDSHLLIKEDMVDFVKAQVKAFNNKNVYTPPAEQQQQ